MSPPAVATPSRTERGRAVPRRRVPTHVPGRPARTRPPRRVSGPDRGRAGAVTAPRSTRALGGRALALVRGLPDHSLIDRLVRSRAWIPMLGVLLAGIVAMQVEILKLGTTIGRSMERSSTLQSQDESLQASVAALADDQRIVKLAGALGMVTPSPTSIVFLSAHGGGDAGRAIANIHAPDPSGFAAELASQAAAAAAMLPQPAGGTTSAAGGTPSASPATTGTPATTTVGGTSSSGGMTASPVTSATSVGSSPAVATSSPTNSTGTPTSSGGPGGSSQPSGPAQPASSSTPATGAAGIAPPANTQAGASTGG